MEISRDKRATGQVPVAKRNLNLSRYDSAVTFEETILSVYQQVLVDGAKIVTLGDETYSVRTTAKQKLKQVDFKFEGRDLRGLEQNPNMKSWWTKIAQEGKKVMQFLEGGKYLAVVANGKAHPCEKQ